MKTFHYQYDWIKNCCWRLPDGEEMMQNQFPIMEEQVQAVVKAVIEHKSDQPRTVIQAGGAFGMYPLRLSYFFERVFTFEPLPANLECLWENIRKKQRSENIFVREYALWKHETMLFMKYSKPVKNSYGAHHVSTTVNEEPVSATTIDTIYRETPILRDIDLIWLDIEGAELFALRGAESVLKEFRPVVVLEDHTLAHTKREFGINHTAARRYLEHEHGYKFHGLSHHDLIFLPQ